MSLRKLEIFYHTAITLNMTKVAKDLYISQPSISQAIHDLEEDLNIKLFDRLGKRLYLTNEGKIYLNYVRRILNIYQEANEVVQGIATSKIARLDIGATMTVGTYILPEVLKNFIQINESLDISIRIENIEHIAELISHNKIDFGIIEGEIENKEIQLEPLCNDEIVFIASKSSRWANQETITLEDLEKVKLVTREVGSGTRKFMDHYFHTIQVQPNIFMELGNPETIIKIVEANIGIGVISKRCLQNEMNCRNLHVLRLEHQSLIRSIYIAVHQDKYMNPHMQNFIAFLKKSIGK